ncbi:probable serine/threonine-protein kinase DDB_G0271402 isoform X2 [Sycon ciliatum]|uniref:probable serine/threonine-protein kinase DDB_G0271402 isoform X2 n=1 Tax=Sycon ciliatum TaxID=27933 RepID=UPI0031F713C2
MARSEGDLLRDLGLSASDIVYLGEIAVNDDDEIGRGADAVVYRIEWQGIPVAVKVVHHLLVQPGIQGRREKLRRFGAEIANLSRLHHPNLCQLLGVGVTSDRGLPALVVELLDATLLQCCVGESRQDDVTCLSYLADAIAGVRYLHSRSVIHRDLTLKNILVKSRTAKVCDFGVARVLQPAGSSFFQQLQEAANLTTCPGTLLYMAPEALAENASYDTSLDVFSFGVLALGVLTGFEPSKQLLFLPRIRAMEKTDGARQEEVITEVERRRMDLDRLQDSHPLKATIVRCLSNVPEERPTAEQLHRTIKDVARLASGLNQVSAIAAHLATMNHYACSSSPSIAADGSSSPSLATMDESRLESSTASMEHSASSQEQQDGNPSAQQKKWFRRILLRPKSSDVTVASQQEASSSGAATGDSDLDRTGSLSRFFTSTVSPDPCAGGGAGRGTQLLSAYSADQLPRRIQKIRKKRKWNKLSVAVGAEKPFVLVHDGALVVVWTTNGRLARIQQTADLRTWHDIGMPTDHRSMEFSSVASHDACLYLQCFDGGHWSFILKYNEEHAYASSGQWQKVVDVPFEGHRRCTLQVTDSAISLFGGFGDHFETTDSVTVYSREQEQWRSSLRVQSQPAVCALPCSCACASMVTCGNGARRYLVGGESACFLRHDSDDGDGEEGQWTAVTGLDGVNLESSAACALANDCMVVVRCRSPAARCVVYQAASTGGGGSGDQQHDLPVLESDVTHYPSVALFNDRLVIGVLIDGIHTLDMSPV